MDSAIRSAIADVKSLGLDVLRVEREQKAIVVTGIKTLALIIEKSQTIILVKISEGFLILYIILHRLNSYLGPNKRSLYMYRAMAVATVIF